MCCTALLCVTAQNNVIVSPNPQQFVKNFCVFVVCVCVVCVCVCVCVCQIRCFVLSIKLLHLQCVYFLLFHIAAIIQMHCVGEWAT